MIWGTFNFKYKQVRKQKNAFTLNGINKIKKKVNSVYCVKKGANKKRQSQFISSN